MNLGVEIRLNLSIKWKLSQFFKSIFNYNSGKRSLPNWIYQRIFPIKFILTSKFIFFFFILFYFFMDGAQISQGHRATIRGQFYFTIKFPEIPGTHLINFLVLIWVSLWGWKAESNLEPPTNFELMTPGLGI